MIVVRCAADLLVAPLVAAMLTSWALPCSAWVRHGFDCNGDGRVDESDTVRALRVAQGIEELERCPALDSNRNGKLEEGEIPNAAPNETMWRYWNRALNPAWRGSKLGSWGELFALRFLSEDEIRSRNHQVTSRYAQLYALRPASFLWAGCAAFVSFQVGVGLGVYETILPLWNQGDLDLLRKINTAVYHDIAWAHLAFAEGGGASTVRAGIEHLPHHEDLYEGFKKIEEGEKLLANKTDPDARQKGLEAIWEGNVLLLWHEQSGVIQDQIRQLSGLAARVLSAATLVDFDGDNRGFDGLTLTSFASTMIRNGRWGDIANLKDRWLWIKQAVLPRWRDAMKAPDFDKRQLPLLEGLLRASNPLPRKSE